MRLLFARGKILQPQKGYEGNNLRRKGGKQRVDMGKSKIFGITLGPEIIFNEKAAKHNFNKKSEATQCHAKRITSLSWIRM